jgi:hypothetical protein
VQLDIYSALILQESILFNLSCSCQCLEASPISRSKAVVFLSYMQAGIECVQLND